MRRAKEIYPRLPILQKHKHYISMELNIRASFQNNCKNHRMYKIILVGKKNKQEIPCIPTWHYSSCSLCWRSLEEIYHTRASVGAFFTQAPLWTLKFYRGHQPKRLNLKWSFILVYFNQVNHTVSSVLNSYPMYLLNLKQNCCHWFSSCTQASREKKGGHI